MIVRIEGPETVSLEGPAEFTRFHMEVRAPLSEDEAHAALERTGAGRLVDRERALVSVEGLRRLAGPHADAAWNAELEKMLAYAKRKGWWDEATASIAAHVEWSAAGSPPR